MAGLRIPTFPVTAKLISSWCYADFQQRQMNGCSCSPKHGLAQITLLGQLFVRMAWSFSETFHFYAGSCSPKHGPVLSTVLKHFFVWMLRSHFKNFQVDDRAALPNIPVTAQLILQRSTFLSSWCYANFQQRSNERLVVLPQTRFSLYHGVKAIFCSDHMKLFKNMQIDGWAVLPQTRPSSIHDVEKPFRLDVMQPFRKHSSWWLSRTPQHPLSRLSSFRGIESFLVLMLCRFSTAFKWTAGRAPPNTVQLNSRRWINFSSGWREAFQNHSKFWLDRALPNTAHFYSRCYRTVSFGCYAAISKTFKLMAGPRSPTFPVTTQLIPRR